MKTVAKTVKEELQTMLVAHELTTEDILDIFVDLAFKLTKERDEARSWKRHFEMYRGAWLRELQPYGYLTKAHEIDSLVLTTQEVVRYANHWCRQESARISKDPFWMVPEPPELLEEKHGEDDSAQILHPAHTSTDHGIEIGLLSAATRNPDGTKRNS